MRAGDYLDLLQALPIAHVDDLVGQEAFVILSPHPDDETLGAGGLIAMAGARRQVTELIIVTDGSGSHPNSKTHPPARLSQLRYAEVQQAAERLGLPPSHVTFLGLVDTLAPSSGAAFESARDRVVHVIEKTGAKTLLVTWQCDPHCDHKATSILAKAVRREIPDLVVWAYPIWGWHLDRRTEIAEPNPKGYRIDISAHLTQKRAAIAAHVSQMTGLIADDPEGFRFSEQTLQPFLGPFEYFIEVPI